jgi:DNA-3-methyladenine glycosylase
MFGPPGVAYVYLIYGLHNCLNVVTEAEDFPAAVLLRAIEPVEGLAGPARGPGLLCRAMEIDRTQNGVSLTAPPLYFLPPEAPHLGRPVASGPRVGIDYAGDSADLPWRFWLADSTAVSRARAPGSGRRRPAGRPPPPRPP